MWKVQLCWSADVSQLSARSGSIPSGFMLPGLKRTRPLNIQPMIALSGVVAVRCGSSEPRSCACMPMLSTVSARPGVAASKPMPAKTPIVARCRYFMSCSPPLLRPPEIAAVSPDDTDRRRPLKASQALLVAHVDQQLRDRGIVRQAQDGRHQLRDVLGRDHLRAVDV